MKIFIYQGLLAVLFVYSVFTQAESAQISTLKVAYLKQQAPEFAGVPQHLKVSATDGIDGASTGIVDANKTGRFLNYQLALSVIELPQSGIMSVEQLQTAASAMALMLDVRSSHFENILNQLEQLEGSRLLLNVTNHEDNIRRRYCRMPLLHVAPSFQMKADALGQWYKTKRLNDVFMLIGDEPEDKQFAQSFMQTAKKFKLNVVAEKAWQFSFDLRRSAFEEIPSFTRTKDDYEVVFVADFAKQFGYSIPYNTYLMTPVTGDAGLKPVAWHHAHEQWGARQLQGRFTEKYRRAMSEYDYLAYLAVTTISTARQQIRANDVDAMYTALVSSELSIAGYKGRPLTFRSGTRQLRQPILLAHQESLVTSAPLAGFMHQTNEMDTLGLPNSPCEEIKQ